MKETGQWDTAQSGILSFVLRVAPGFAISSVPSATTWAAAFVDLRELLRAASRA